MRSSCILVLIACGGFAAGDPVNPRQLPVPDEIRDANNMISVSGLARRVNYQENNNGLVSQAGDVLDSEKGWMAGVLIDGSLQLLTERKVDLYLRARLALSWGGLTYNGAYQNDPTTPVTATSNATMTDLDLTVGFGLGLGEHAAMTPFFSYAYRLWNRNLGGAQLGGQREAYGSHAIEVGVLVQAILGERVIGSLSGKIGGIVHASVDVEPIPPATLGLGSTVILGGEASLAVRLSSSPRLHLFLAYDICSFGFGRSEMMVAHGYAITEPDSETLEQEARVGLGYGF